LQAPDVPFYPLRPELVESTYLLYQVLRCSELTARVLPKVAFFSHFSPPAVPAVYLVPRT